MMREVAAGKDEDGPADGGLHGDEDAAEDSPRRHPEVDDPPGIHLLPHLEGAEDRPGGHDARPELRLQGLRVEAGLEEGLVGDDDLLQQEGAPGCRDQLV